MFKKENILWMTVGIVFGLTFSASAATFQIDSSKSLLAICQQILGASAPSPTPMPSPTPSPAPSPTPSPSPAPSGNEITFKAYNTLFGWPDNTPNNSSELSTGGMAGGTGTYNDPITVAVGWQQIGGKEVLDYPYGTKFYIPDFKKYFVVGDECGDPPHPESKMCHKSGMPPYPQIDLWAGGVGSKMNTAAGNKVLDCEDANTGLHTMIQNPAPGLPVKAGDICTGSTLNR